MLNPGETYTLPSLAVRLLLGLGLSWGACRAGVTGAQEYWY